MALATDDLDETHRQILDLLREGRITPTYVAEEIDESRQLVGKKLRELRIAGHVDRVSRGLYELTDDPEGE